jgi:hypothetical protein
MKFLVMAGLVPAISLMDALCFHKRDARHKAGHDRAWVWLYSPG